jgi:hypothetical protein
VGVKKKLHIVKYHNNLIHIWLMLCDFIRVMEVHHMNFRGGLNTHKNEGFPGGVMFSWRHNTHENETTSVNLLTVAVG